MKTTNEGNGGTLRFAVLLLLAYAGHSSGQEGALHMALLHTQHTVSRLAPGLPSSTTSFTVDGAVGDKVYVRSTASAESITVWIAGPQSQVIDAATVIGMGGWYAAFEGTDTHDSPFMLPTSDPGYHFTFSFPSLGPGNYTVLFDATAPPAEEIAILVEMTLDSALGVNLFPAEPIVAAGRRVNLFASVIEGSQPKVGATVSVRVLKPSGAFFYIHLRDDGGPYDGLAGDGLYSGSVIANEVGEWLAVADITGTTSAGHPFKRTAATRVEVISPCARFTGQRTEYGLDANNNGRFEAMMIQPEIEVFRPAEFLLEVELVTASGKTMRARGRQQLPAGIQVMDAKLTAADLWAADEDGPYAITSMSLTCIEPDQPIRPSGLMAATVEEAPMTQVFMRPAFEPIPNDCNHNGRPDDIDISSGVSEDCEENGVPDECETVACSGTIGVEEAGSRYYNLTPYIDGDCSFAIAITGFETSSHTDLSCVHGYVDPESHLVVESPVFQTEAQWGTTYVTGGRLIPGGWYRFHLESCDGVVVPGIIWSYYLWAYGDTTGEGLCELADVLCILSAYSGQFVGACTPRSAELAGGPNCAVDDLIELADLVVVLNAYAGGAFECPVSCGEPLMGGGGSGGEGMMGGGFFGPPTGFDNTITFTATPTTITSGQTVTIRAFLIGPPDLHAVQVAVDVAGGTSGTLSLTSLSVETARSDFVFNGQACVTPTNLDAGRLAGALYEGGVEMVESTLYLGRFVFTASANAVGTFTINARVSETKLLDSAGQPLTWTSIPKNVVVTAP